MEGELSPGSSNAGLPREASRWEDSRWPTQCCDQRSWPCWLRSKSRLVSGAVQAHRQHPKWGIILFQRYWTNYPYAHRSRLPSSEISETTYHVASSQTAWKGHGRSPSDSQRLIG